MQDRHPVDTSSWTKYSESGREGERGCTVKVHALKNDKADKAEKTEFIVRQKEWEQTCLSLLPNNNAESAESPLLFLGEYVTREESDTEL